MAILDRAIEPENPLQYSDILKFSLCSDTLIQRCQIEGGSEDAIDACRGSNYKVYNSAITPHGKNGMTFKGFIEGVDVQDTVFTNHGSECDIELGQFCIYDEFPFSKKTKHVQLVNVTSLDGSPIHVKVWNANSPTVIGGDVKITKINPILVWLYFAMRRIQYKLSGKK